MKKTVLTLTITFIISMFIGSIAFAADEPDTSTKFSGNLRFGYKNMQDNADAADSDWAENEDDFSVHYLELQVRKQVGPVGIFLNERIGGASNRNYLYEGWISYKAPGQIGSFKVGKVPHAFGIFKNGLYYPKGVPFAKGYMWQYGYGVNYANALAVSDTLNAKVEATYLDKGIPSDCCRDNVMGRVGVDLKGPLAASVGGSLQYGKLKAVPVDGVLGDDETKLAFAGDITLKPDMLPIPVALMGEFINYSNGESDALKGNIMMGQLTLTPIKGKGLLNAAMIDLHFSMDSPSEGDSLTTLIGQIHLVLAKQLHVFAQVFGNTLGDDDMSGKGTRIWLMYIF